MEIFDGFETVKQKLIIAGISEIEEHGIQKTANGIQGQFNNECSIHYTRSFLLVPRSSAMRRSKSARSSSTF